VSAKAIDDLSNKELLQAVTTMVDLSSKQSLEAMTAMVDLSSKQLLDAVNIMINLGNKQLLETVASMIDTLTDAIADMFAHQTKIMATKEDIARLERKFEHMRAGLALAAKPI